MGVLDDDDIGQDDRVTDLMYEYMLALEDQAEHVKYNKLDHFDPYPYQAEFVADHSTELALRAGNQQGKTLVTTAWDAMDLTGRYPEWYEGIRTNKPIVLVCGCVNNDKTRDILQSALFGDPIEWEKELGTGWVPLDCIGKIQKKRGVPDAFYNVRIKHHDENGDFDGWSKVVFLAYEMGKATWMAHKADINHLDEEPPLEILEQAGRSGIATHGRIRISFTPENGVTEVVKMVQNDWSMHTAEWADVSGSDFDYTVQTSRGEETVKFKTVRTLGGKPGHLTEDMVRAAGRKFPPHTMLQRMKGIPVLGTGLVFKYPEESIRIEPINLPDHFLYLDGIDFGGLASTAHPTAFARAAYDSTNDKIIIYDGFKTRGKEIPENAAFINMKTNSDIIPVVWPHDGQKGKDGETTRDQYESAGVNMYVNETNPLKSWATHKPPDNKKEGDGGNKVMPSIDEMSIRLNDGRLVVFSTVFEFFEEYRQFHMKDGVIVDLDDDFISAVRYIVMMIRNAVTLEHTKVVFNQSKRHAGGWMGG